MAAGIALFLALAAVMVGGLFHEPLAGNFYAVFPHNTLALMFGLVFGYAVFALGMGVARFWRDVSPGAASRGGGRGRATRCACATGRRTARGCNNADDAFTLWRRRFHHCTFYGFSRVTRLAGQGASSGALRTGNMETDAASAWLNMALSPSAPGSSIAPMRRSSAPSRLSGPSASRPPMTAQYR